MRPQYLFLVILFCLLVSFPAIASDWVVISSTKSHATYVDKQSINGDATSIKFWGKMVFKKEQLDSYSGKYYISTIEYVEIDCNNNIAKLHEITHYAVDEEVISHSSYSTLGISRIAPDTTGERVKEYVCSFKQTK